ncbi:unnamed protein product [Closterium sp. Naga37s-1]|nr:unnamed protein product [Closterium sp. Naga37s-1]
MRSSPLRTDPINHLPCHPSSSPIYRATPHLRPSTVPPLISAHLPCHTSSPPIFSHSPSLTPLPRATPAAARHVSSPRAGQSRPSALGHARVCSPLRLRARAPRFTFRNPLPAPTVSSIPSPSSLAALHPLLSGHSHPATSAALACLGAEQREETARGGSCWQGGARVGSEGGERDGEGERDGGARGDDRMEGVAMGERGEGEGAEECGRAVAGAAGYGSVSAERDEGSSGARLELAHGMGAEGRGARPELRRVLFGELQRLRNGCDDVSSDGGGGGMGPGRALEQEMELRNAMAGRGEHKVRAWEHEWSSCDPMHGGGDEAREMGGGARGRGEWDSDEEAAGRWGDADGVLQLSAEEYEALLLDMQRALYEEEDGHLETPVPSGHRSMEEEEAYQQGMEDEEIMAALAYQQEAMVICPLCKARPLHMHGATIECSCGHFSLHTHHDHVTLEPGSAAAGGAIHCQQLPLLPLPTPMPSYLPTPRCAGDFGASGSAAAGGDVAACCGLPCAALLHTPQEPWRHSPSCTLPCMPLI